MKYETRIRRNTERLQRRFDHLAGKKEDRLISSHIGSAMGKRPEIPAADGAADGKSECALR